MTSNTDIVLSAPSAFGVRDIVLRASGAPLYTPAVYVRDVAASMLTSADSTSRLMSFYRVGGDDTAVPADLTGHVLLSPRTASDVAPTTVDSTAAQYLFVRVGEELVPLLDETLRVTDVSRSEQASFQNTQASAQPATMYLRTPGQPCLESADGVTPSSTFPRQPSEAVALDVTALRVADVLRSTTEAVALTDSTQALRAFPRSASDALTPPADAALRLSAYYRQVQDTLTQTATALREALTNYVPGPSPDPGGLVVARGAAMQSDTLAATDARSGVDPAVGGTLGPAAGMMNGYELALLDAVPTLEDA